MIEFGEIIKSTPGLSAKVFMNRNDSHQKRYGKFTCKLCGKEVSYRLYDRTFFAGLEWECPECYVLIASQRYEVNIKGGITVFSPMGKALGDQIIQEVIRRRYLADNPDETVIFLDEWSNNVFEIYQPNKVFWANLHSGGLRRPKRALWFSLCNEVNAFARQGHYSQFKFELSERELANFQPFDGSVVFHLRQIDKAAETKNIETHFVYAILTLLHGLRAEKIVLIGDDGDSGGIDLETIHFVLGNGLPIYDFRNRLTLNQIAWLCHQARLYIGKDSGPAHLAGAAGCRNMVVWGYQTDRYFPKVAPGVCMAFTRENSLLHHVMEAIRQRMS